MEDPNLKLSASGKLIDPENEFRIRRLVSSNGFVRHPADISYFLAITLDSRLLTGNDRFAESESGCSQTSFNL